MQKTCEEVIPESAVKMTPETDQYPPILHSSEREDPIPLRGLINTASAEDSPFIPIQKSKLYFCITPDVQVPKEEQLLGKITGIYLTKLEGRT